MFFFPDTQHSLLILHLIALMCERLGESILRNASQMLVFIESTLKRACAIMHADEEGVGTAFITETLTMALGMLSAMLGGAVEVILSCLFLNFFNDIFFLCLPTPLSVSIVPPQALTLTPPPPPQPLTIW